MSDRPLPYTTNPATLLKEDVKLFFKATFDWRNLGLLSVIWPLGSRNADDELSLTCLNIRSISIHVVLILLQTAYIVFLLLSPFCGIPALAYLLVLVLGVQLNKVACNLFLNGFDQRSYYAGGDFARNSGDPNLKYVPDKAGQAGERWVFINGVAVNSHWMDCNLRRIAQTFRRPILGFHNKTYGIVFDVLECVIQRTFGYPTLDIRTAYITISDILKQTETKKLVMIAHSQGAIEAGMILDWLFATLQRDQVAKLEVYTFGAAANHFNSPEWQNGSRVIKHIEHYINKSDWVARFGVLYFRGVASKQPNGSVKKPVSSLRRLWRSATGTLDIDVLRNRFVGKLFIRAASGHMLNQHYFANIFKLDAEGCRVVESNPFMDAMADGDNFDSDNDTGSGAKPGMLNQKSRLWQYRNGDVPKNDE